MGIFSGIAKLFSKKESGPVVYRTDNMYRQMRQMMLTVDPGTLKLPPPQLPQEVWAVLMETGIQSPKGVYTMVALADGTASLYFHNGGGIIGAGEHEGPANAAKELVKTANDMLRFTEAAQQHPLPNPGETRFILRTYSGDYAGSALERELRARYSNLTKLYFAAQDLITQIRLAQEGQIRSAQQGQR